MHPHLYSNKIIQQSKTQQQQLKIFKFDYSEGGSCATFSTLSGSRASAKMFCICQLGHSNNTELHYSDVT